MRLPKHLSILVLSTATGFAAVSTLVPPPEETSFGLNEQAVIVQAKGSYADAEVLYREALRRWETETATDTQGLAAVLNNLGSLYYVQGRYAEAEPVLSRATALCSRDSAGAQCATALVNLAATYRSLARFAEAKPLYERALRIREQLWGDSDPRLVHALVGMAQLWQDLGDYERAEASARRALLLLESSGKIEGPELATAISTLAGVRHSQGWLPESESLYRRALEHQERVLGADHPLVADTLVNIAYTCRLQDRLTEAHGLYQRALAMLRLQHRPRQTATALNNLGSVERALGNSKAALEHHREALAIWTKVNGPSHPDVSAGLTNLAALYQDRREWEKSEKALQEALRIDRSFFPPDHPRIAVDLNNAAALAMDRKRPAEAEEFLVQSLAITEKRLTSDHPQLGTTLANLAEVYRAQRKLDQAVGAYGRAVDILTKSWGPKDRRLLPTLERYSNALRARNDYATAARVDAEAMRIRVTMALR